MIVKLIPFNGYIFNRFLKQPQLRHGWRVVGDGVDSKNFLSKKAAKKYFKKCLTSC